MARKVNLLKIALLLIGFLALFMITGIAIQFFQATDKNLVVSLFFLVIVTAVLLGLRVLFFLNRILNCIKGPEAFSSKTLYLVTKVKNTILVIGVVMLGILPFFYHVADVEDAPGVMVIGFIILLIPFTAYIFSQIVEELFKKATTIQVESDLTI